MRLIMIVLTAVIVEGCACTSEGRFAVRVRVLDEATGEQITSTPIGIVTYGENLDTLYASPNHVLTGGPTEPGTYDVEVRAEGYRVWRRENVKVSESGWCAKVQTAELTAKMVRMAAGGSQTGEAERSRPDASPLGITVGSSASPRWPGSQPARMRPARGHAFRSTP